MLSKLLVSARYISPPGVRDVGGKWLCYLPPTSLTPSRLRREGPPEMRRGNLETEYGTITEREDATHHTRISEAIYGRANPPVKRSLVTLV